MKTYKMSVFISQLSILDGLIVHDMYIDVDFGDESRIDCLFKKRTEDICGPW